MATIVPNPERIKSFRTAAEFERWLRANHDRASEIWLKIHKKNSGLPTVTATEALDVALCWGWIDSQRKAFDERSFLQRYSPRGARSVWSQINRASVARLVKAGRMTAHGQRQVDHAAGVSRNDPRRPPGGDRREPARQGNLQDLESPEPLRAGVQDQRAEDAGRTRAQDRGARRDARARRDTSLSAGEVA